MPDPICQSCGRKLGKGDGRLRCRRCQPTRQTSPKLHLKDITANKVPFAIEYPPVPKPIVIHRQRPEPKPRELRYCDCGEPLGPSNHSGKCLFCRANNPVYLPTLEEIAEACREIRSEWSPHEERIRRAVQPIDGVTARTLRDPRMNQ